MPVGVSDDVEKWMRDFFWENCHEGKTTFGSVEGCLSIKGEWRVRDWEIQDRNSALLAKWLWRFPLEKNALWHKVILSIYGLNHDQWEQMNVCTKLSEALGEDLFKPVQINFLRG